MIIEGLGCGLIIVLGCLFFPLLGKFILLISYIESILIMFLNCIKCTIKITIWLSIFEVRTMYRTNVDAIMQGIRGQ